MGLDLTFVKVTPYGYPEYRYDLEEKAVAALKKYNINPILQISNDMYIDVDSIQKDYGSFELVDTWFDDNENFMASIVIEDGFVFNINFDFYIYDSYPTKFIRTQQVGYFRSSYNGTVNNVTYMNGSAMHVIDYFEMVFKVDHRKYNEPLTVLRPTTLKGLLLDWNKLVNYIEKNDLENDSDFVIVSF